MILCKYDFSHAFGTLCHERFLESVKVLNLDDQSMTFLKHYFLNQKINITITQDKSGYFESSPVTVNRGIPQGQIGSELIFIIQSLALKNLENVYRTSYIDDLNDVISQQSPELALSKALENESELIIQSKQIGFKLNPEKTEFLNFNLDDSVFGDRNPLSNSTILGIPFATTSRGINIEPLIDLVKSRLNQKIPLVHATRSYTNDPLLRIKIMRSLVYYSIGDLHIAYGYGSKLALKDILVITNKLIRATGLSNKTPQTFLNKFFGTSIENFVRDCIVLNGLKIGKSKNLFDRIAKIRFTEPNTYMSKFKDIWNSFPIDRRKLFLRLEIDKVKNILKKERRLTFSINDFIKYKWFVYNKDENKV